MNIYRARLFAACIVVGIAVAVGACADGTEDSDLSALEQTEGLLELIQDGERDYLLVDVRTSGEYAGGHIPTAVNIPYQNIVEGLPDGPKNRLIIVYCRTGSRSGHAERSLRNAGYSNVVDYGGILSWGGPIEYGDSEG
jgi:rhodanese-related sulfurtransferase